MPVVDIASSSAPRASSSDDPYRCYKCGENSQANGLGRLLQCTGCSFINLVEQNVAEYNASIATTPGTARPLLLCKKGSNYRKANYKCNFSAVPRFFHASCVGHDKAAAFANKITTESKVAGKDYKELVVMKDNLLKHLCNECYTQHTSNPLPVQPDDKQSQFLEKRRAVKLASKRKCVQTPHSRGFAQRQRTSPSPGLPAPIANLMNAALGSDSAAQLDLSAAMNPVDAMHLVKLGPDGPRECEWCTKMEGRPHGTSPFMCMRCNVHLCADECFWKYHTHPVAAMTLATIGGLGTAGPSNVGAVVGGAVSMAMSADMVGPEALGVMGQPGEEMQPMAAAPLPVEAHAHAHTHAHVHTHAHAHALEQQAAHGHGHDMAQHVHGGHQVQQPEHVPQHMEHEMQPPPHEHVVVHQQVVDQEHVDQHAG